MTFDRKVHHYEKQADNTTRLTSVNPYCRLTDPNTGAKVFLRAGKAWDAQGTHIKPTPNWCIDQLKTMNRVVVQECGFEHLLPTKKADTDVPLQDRMKAAVEKGIMSQAEYELMFPETEDSGDTTEDLGDVEEDLSLQSDISSTYEADEEATDTEFAAIVSDMKRTELQALCKERGIPMQPTDKNEDLRAKLIAA